VEVTEKDIEDFKKSCKKNGIEYKTDQEYREAAYNLYGFAELLFKIYREEKARENRLKDEPKGFAFPGEGRMCPLCGHGVGNDENMWFDKWGMKCMPCQNALNKKIIPGYVFKDHDNDKHITASRLEWKLKVKQQTIRKLVREDKLKARVITGHKYGDVLVFLRKENPNLKSIIETAKNEVLERKAAKQKKENA
jgi:hypothetical protein